jgi:hypothetical protein
VERDSEKVNVQKGIRMDRDLLLKERAVSLERAICSRQWAKLVVKAKNIFLHYFFPLLNVKNPFLEHLKKTF